METKNIYIEAAGLSDKGQVRENNEDGFAAVDFARVERFGDSFNWKSRIIGEKGVLLAVSDGMGGARGGEIASRMTLELLDEIVTVEQKLDQPTLGKIIKSVSFEVHRFAEENPNLSGMGATLTAVFINNGSAIIGQIGDSRAYLLRNSRLIRLTKDQSFVESLVEAGVMTRKEAEISPNKNILTSAVGQKDEVTPGIAEIELERGDILLLCSDGLTNMVADDELQNILGEDKDPREKCEQLVKLANNCGGKDNITVIVAHLSGEGLPAAFEEYIQTKKFPRELF